MAIVLRPKDLIHSNLGKIGNNISFEHGYCSLAKEAASVNSENKITKNISFEHAYCSSAQQPNHKGKKSAVNKEHSFRLNFAIFRNNKGSIKLIT